MSLEPEIYTSSEFIIYRGKNKNNLLKYYDK